MTAGHPRIGLLVCSCWSRSEAGIDADRIVAESLGMEDLVHAEVTDDLCGVGAATLAGDLVRRHSLDRLVVGACACCPQDQRCAACNPERAGLREAVKAATQLPWSHHAFVNLRDHHTITNEAIAVIAMAIARMDATPQDVPHRGSREPVRAALVIGAGAVGRAAAVELGERGIPTHLVDQAAPTGAGTSAPRNITLHVPSVVKGLEGGGGDFRVTVAGMGEEVLLRMGAVLVAPGLAEEETGAGVGWGLPHRSMETSPRRIQGTFLAGEDGTSSAGAVAAFLGRTLRGTQAVAFVHPETCISCMKCLPVCPYSAISRPSVPDGPVLVDPLLCAGCGACTSACMNWAVDQTGHSTVELEVAIRASAKRMRALLVVCNWSAYRAMDQACQDGLLPKGVAKLRVPCLARVSPHLVQVALDSGVDPLIIAGCSERGCHFRGRRSMLEEHMANLEAGLAGTGDLDRVFVISLGPTDKDVLATRVVEALESRRYAREERGPITEHAKDTEWTRGWSA